MTLKQVRCWFVKGWERALAKYPRAVKPRKRLARAMWKFYTP